MDPYGITGKFDPGDPEFHQVSFHARILLTIDTGFVLPFCMRFGKFRGK
jgi:hypothetical protein